MLTRQLETPNLHEIGLDRVIAFGHTWSPTLELTPRIPLRHGHAITVSILLDIADPRSTWRTQSPWLSSAA